MHTSRARKVFRCILSDLEQNGFCFCIYISLFRICETSTHIMRKTVYINKQALNFRTITFERLKNHIHTHTHITTKIWCNRSIFFFTSTNDWILFIFCWLNFTWNFFAPEKMSFFFCKRLYCGWIIPKSIPVSIVGCADKPIAIANRFWTRANVKKNCGHFVDFKSK